MSSQCLSWVKNGRDAFEMGCLYYPRKQTSVSYRAVDDEIIGWLEKRKQR